MLDGNPFVGMTTNTADSTTVLVQEFDLYGKELKTIDQDGNVSVTEYDPVTANKVKETLTHSSGYTSGVSPVD